MGVVVVSFKGALGKVWLTWSHHSFCIQDLRYRMLATLILILLFVPCQTIPGRINRTEKWNGGRGKQGQTGDKSINRNLLRNGRLGIQKFKGQDQRTSSQFNSQAIYIVISGTVYSENTPGSTLLVLFHANKF